MVFKPFGGFLAGVLGVIILLENDVVLGFAIVFNSALNFFIQDLDIKIPIHPSINLASMSNTLPCHTAPHHYRSSTKLLSPLYQPVTQSLPSLFPHPFPTIRP